MKGDGRGSRILFIYPNRYAQIGFHYGLASLSAVLKGMGCRTRLINLNEKLDRLPTLEEIREIVLDFRPHLIGFTLVTLQFSYAVEVAKGIRSFWKGSIMAGGVHATMDPAGVLETGAFDYVCRGEGEEALADFLRRMEKGEDLTTVPNIWAKRGKKVFSNPVRPLALLENLPAKDYGLFDMGRMLDKKDGWVGIMTSRGCPFRCTYCFNHRMVQLYRQDLDCSFKELRYIRHHPVEDVMGEMGDLLRTYGSRIKMFIFDDDLFTFDRTYLEEFCLEYERSIGIPFVCNAHVRVFDRDMAKVLKRAGCRIVKFGLESGSERVRSEILKRAMSDEEIARAFKVAEEEGLHSSAFLMLGLPFEKEGELWETVDLVARTKPGRFRWSIFFPFPGTDAYDLSVKGGFLDLEKMKRLTNFTEESCLRFGEEQDLLIEKMAEVFPWFVNSRADLRCRDLYEALVQEVLQMDRESWNQIKGKLKKMERELSDILVDVGEKHYAIRYESFMGVRSDYFTAEHSREEWIQTKNRG